jgi:hypothetical protein
MRSQFALAMTLAINSVQAYWGTAHLLGKFINSLQIPINLNSFDLIYLTYCVVAAQAQAFLEQENPEILELVLAELNTLKVSHPTLVTRELHHPFTETATFADDIKS